MARIFGVQSQDGLSGHLKCTITGKLPSLGEITVVGYIGEGASKSLTSNWESPFEGDTVGNAGVLDKASSLTQVYSDRTSKTQLNSRLVWEGVSPPELNMPLYFHALTNAKLEVEDAIMALEAMASPELNELTPGGRVPITVIVDVGRRLKLPNVIIRDVSSELDAPRDRSGYMIRNTVQLTCSMNGMVNQSDIPKLYV